MLGFKPEARQTWEESKDRIIGYITGAIEDVIIDEQAEPEGVPLFRFQREDFLSFRDPLKDGVIRTSEPPSKLPSEDGDFQTANPHVGVRGEASSIQQPVICQPRAVF